MLTEQQSIELFNKLNKDGWAPEASLDGLPYATIKTETDLLSLPKKNCAYWIATTEPVEHSMHKHQFPQKMNDGFEIIYNGVAGDLRGRMKNHLFRDTCAGLSGISVDIFTQPQSPGSHVKKAFSTKPKDKVIYVQGSRVSNKEDLLKMNLTQQEESWINTSTGNIFLWNGINVTWPKHVNHEWRVYYYQCDQSMSSFVEIKWRERHGHPRLISYLSGR
jgi:hypothetical protein